MFLSLAAVVQENWITNAVHLYRLKRSDFIPIPNILETLQVVTGIVDNCFYLIAYAHQSSSRTRAAQVDVTKKGILAAAELGSPGSLNVEKLQRCSELRYALAGLDVAVGQAHSPNQNFPIENFELGVRLNQELLVEIAKVRDEEALARWISPPPGAERARAG